MTAKTKEQLAAEYIAKIGYDPFADDPSISVEEVAAILAECDEIAADAGLIARIGRAEIYLMDGEYYVYGVTASGDPRVCPSEGMAREIAAGAAA